MDNNTNQTATPEIKTEEVATKEKTKKVKEKKPKEPKEPMDKQDQLCYLGAMIFFILALLPILMRNFDPNYDEFRDPSDDKTEKPAPVEKKNLICSKEVKQAGYSYIIEVQGYYENGEPKSSVITYLLEITDESAYTFDTVEITEFETLKSIQETGVTSSVEEPTIIDGVNKKVYKINLNFTQNANLTQNTLLDSHNKMYMIQKENYQTEGYMCINQ